MLVHNAKIWTGTGEASWMTINTATGYVLDVGSGPPPLQDVPPDQQRDLGGRQVFPGFHESHIHILDHGKNLSTLNLYGCQSIGELQTRISKYVQANSDCEWVFGSFWNQTTLGRYPTRLDLDEVCPDKPVFLRRVCMHVAVLNSKALTLLGITKDTPQPEGGVIDIFPAGHPHAGEPTGILRENAMTKNVSRVPFSSKQKKEFICVAMQDVIKNGVTSVHTLEEEGWTEYCELADEGALPIRVFYCPYWTSRHSADFPAGPEAARGHHLACSRVKLFTDGALGVSTAALSQPYKGTCNCGVFIHQQEDLNAMVSDATGQGHRLEIHVIGDAAAESAIVALEKAQVTREKRPVFAHCQILRHELLSRMAARGVIATIQPQFVPTDGQVVDDLLPEALHEYSYAWKTLSENGVVCAGSSDAPVEEPKPMLGMYDAIFRQVGERDPANKKQHKPSECLSFAQAMDLYTKAGAYTAMREHDLGQLRPGYRADFVVLEAPRDLPSHPEDLLVTKVTEVWVDGGRVL